MEIPVPTFQVAEVFTSNSRKLVPIAETISRFQEVLAGKPEVACYRVVSVDEVVARQTVWQLKLKLDCAAFTGQDHR